MMKADRRVRPNSRPPCQLFARSNEPCTDNWLGARRELALVRANNRLAVYGERRDIRAKSEAFALMEAWLIAKPPCTDKSA